MQTGWLENLVSYQFSLDPYALHLQSTCHLRSVIHRAALEGRSHPPRASSQTSLHPAPPMAHYFLLLLIWLGFCLMFQFSLHQFRNQIPLVAC